MSFSFRMFGNLRVHGVAILTEESYKNIAKIMISHVLTGVDVDQDVKLVLCLKLYQHLSTTRVEMNEGTSEFGNMKAIFSDFDLKGFSSVDSSSPMKAIKKISKTMSGTIVSSSRLTQLRFVGKVTVTLSPFNLFYWDKAVSAGYAPVIPPLHSWWDSITLNKELIDALKVRKDRDMTMSVQEPLTTERPRVTEEPSTSRSGLASDSQGRSSNSESQDRETRRRERGSSRGTAKTMLMKWISK